MPLYTEKQRQAAVDEMKNNNVPQVKEMLKDCKVLRDQVRVK